MLISIIIPVYNSESTIDSLVNNLTKVLDQNKIQIVLVNDGSEDESDNKCRRLYEKYPKIVEYLKLSKNFGEHNAVLAGLNYSKGDYAVIMDDDFQNPPEEVSKLVDQMIKNDFDVLYTYYDKKYHSFFRNLSSWFNNWCCNFILKKPKSLYLSSFKCISRFVVNEIKKYTGPYPYIDGLILRTTRNIGQIKVRHESRKVGKSSYTLRKLISLWLNMFMNFSNIPLRLSFFIGCVLSIFGVCLIVFFVFDMYIWHSESAWPPGWMSLIVCIVTFSGSQLIFLGLLGEYLGKLYLTENKTPQFIVRELYGEDSTDK